MGGGVPNTGGPRPHYDHLGTHQLWHKSWVSLHGPPNAHGILGSLHGEVRDITTIVRYFNILRDPFSRLYILGYSQDQEHESHVMMEKTFEIPNS